MEFDDDPLPLSGLQHLAFCPRQWALIHLEQVWSENRLTAEGRLLHEHADLPGQSRRAGLRTVRGMLLQSHRLRLSGRADVVLALCCERGVGISLLSEQGRFLARVQGPVSGNVLLRRQQYRTADGADLALPLVRSIVMAKVANSRVVLLRGARDTGNGEAKSRLSAAAERLSRIGLDSSRAAAIDEARGHEGTAGQVYFSVFGDLIVGDVEVFRFGGRSRRPPLDRVNALLSFLYALLRHDIESALESVGLDPAVGFLHTDRPGRPSLALDMMEELRAPLADRMALTLINRRQLQALDFTEEEGGVSLAESGRKAAVAAWQTRKQSEIEHPFLQERIPVGLVPYVQALLLARCLRGGLDGYPAYLWR